jgi:glycosyltransferase involved in cell wall biosynthesis
LTAPAIERSFRLPNGWEGTLEREAEPVSVTRLSVVVPVFDERENLAPLVAELRRELAGLGIGFEIVAVDDGSRDGGREVLAKLAGEVPELRVLGFDRNRGKSAALAAGFDAARGDAIVTIDADLQNDPADIARMLEALPGCDLVAGVRRQRNDTWLRRLSSRVANGVRGRVLGDGVRDTGCALKLFRREQAARFARFEGMHRFLPALVQIQGGRVVEVPVNDRPRHWGRAKYGVGNRLFRGLLDMAGVWWLRRRALRFVVESEIDAQAPLRVDAQAPLRVDAQAPLRVDAQAPLSGPASARRDEEIR